MASRNRKLNDFERGIAALIRSRLTVGIAGEDASRGDNAINYAALGYLFEYGEPATNMPPRPWLIPVIESRKDEITEHLKGIAQKILKRSIEQPGYDPKADIEKSLQLLGLRLQSAIQTRISAGIDPPLSERTIYARLHRKKNRRSPGPMTPLIDTGGFVRSIRYTVKV